MRRLILVASAVVALLVPTTMMTLVVSTPAWATVISCTSLSGRAMGVDAFKIGACTPAQLGDTLLKAPGTELTTIGGPTPDTWTWTTSGQTTIVSISVTAFTLSAGDCPTAISQYHGFTVIGDVTGGTSTYTAAGGPVSLTVCKKNAAPHHLYLVHGTTVVI